MLTIGIPTYNRKNQLINTLHCLKNQTNKNFKIIIVDNHSSYDVKKVLIRNFDSVFLSKIELVVRTVNVGGDNNIMGLFDEVKNGWLWMVSDDDIEYEDSVDKIHKYIAENEDSAVIHFVEGDYVASGDIYSLESYIDSIYNNVNKNNAELVWGEFANICNKVYNLDIIKNRGLDTAFLFSNCSMTSGLVLLSALMCGNKITVIRDTLHHQNPGGWNIKRVALSSRAICDIDFGISYKLKCKLLYIINFPYRVVLHYWLLPEAHYDEDCYIEKLYYGFYRYHLPFKEKMDYWIRMKLFSVDIIYRLHLWIHYLEHRIKKKRV